MNTRVRPRNRFLTREILVVIILICAIPCNGWGQCRYTRQEIVPPADWPFVTPMAINNLGHVVGYLQNNGETERAFIWTPEGGTQVLPAPPEGAYQMRATDINDLDHVVGWMAATGYGVTAFLWDGTVFTLIPPPYANTRIEPYGINNLDQIVGELNGPMGRTAFFWEAGTLVDLGPILDLPRSRAVAINDHQQIAGSSTASGVSHAFLLDDEPQWLPEPGIVQSSAGALASNGLAAGQGNRAFLPSDPKYRGLGVVWDGLATHFIPAPPGLQHTHCHGINNAGRVVGSYTYPQSYYNRGFVWQAGVAYDLQTLTGIRDVSRVAAINDLGQIACHSNIGRLVLTPVWVAGDLTGDCHVSLQDLLLLLADFGSPFGSFPRGDIDLDGDVDITDLAELLANWGT